MLLILLFTWICCDYAECQSISALEPHCFDTTTCPCCSVPCPSNGSGQCGGKCQDGYHGGKCYNKCPYNCIRCVDAPLGGGVSSCTLCRDGYYSTESLYQCQSACSIKCKICVSNASYCTSCKDGYYLNNNVCVQCLGGCSACISEMNCTSCNIGHYLDKAKPACHRCNPLCLACNSSETCFCSNGCQTQRYGDPLTACQIASNLCSYGCKAGFNLSNPINTTKDVCDKCIDGMYGIECNKTCHSTCDPHICERLSGNCSCREGYYGEKCALNCPNNCSCDKVTGRCLSCSDGYYGTHCAQECVVNCKTCTITSGICEVCKDGFYGNNCYRTCSDHCFDKKCNMTNGNCVCVSGYTGPTCEVEILTATTAPNLLVVTEDPNRYLGPAVGGTLSAIIIIASVVIAIFLVHRRRRAFIYVPYKIDFDSYKLDSRLIDVLEENDEFDSTYFTGKADDTKKPSGHLSVKDLAQFVNTRGDDFYQEEFLKLPRGLIKSCNDAKKEENVVKNRYTGIYPYDEHRVRLQSPGSDFINACYMNGYKRKKEYIASLGPTRKAMEGFQLFWRMVWQEKTDVIVMVTNLMEGQSMKCEKYWPDAETPAQYGEITVTLQTETVYAEFVERIVTLTKGNEQRIVHHLHYTAWPDKQVPDDITSLIEFRQKVKAIGSNLGGPTIVHCSAGIGRTGTYIALDILIQQGKAQKSLDIFEYIVRLRQQRTSMVQTWQQYQYLHHALVYALTYHCEPLKQSKINTFMDNLSEKKITTLFKQLDRKQDKAIESEQEEEEVNKGLEGMNREGADIPGSMFRPFLHMDKKFDENSYINAIFLNSYTVKNHFMVCQTPLPYTVKDFLTLIIQESCSCIVSMDPPGLKDQTIGKYFPTTSEPVFKHPSDMFKVEAKNLDTNHSYTLRRLLIQFNRLSGAITRTVYHFQYHDWPKGNRLPDLSNFLQLVQDVENMSGSESEGGPVLVHCLNAAERSGLFCAVSNLLQKMKMEGEVSVVNTLRQVKARRPLAIPNKVIKALVFLWIYFGYVESQTISAAALECFDNTTCPCCTVPCPLDESGFCRGMCKDGYHGGKCYNLCPSNCIRCVDATARGGVSNCTQCKDGFYSNQSLYQCQSRCSSSCTACESSPSNCSSCSEGYYYKEFYQCVKCNEECTSCESDKICTSCKVGYYLDPIQHTCRECNSMCFACNSSATCFCSNGCKLGGASASMTDCIIESNACAFGCRTNFTSTNSALGLCDKCVDDVYGYNCQLSCNSNCYPKECDRITGKCNMCNDGYYGDVCDLQCPKKCPCDKETGRCFSCIDGFYGMNCSQQCVSNCQKCDITDGACSSCVDGYYGDTCNSVCSKHCKEKRCAMTDGSCSCVSGYTGSTCDFQTTLAKLESTTQIVVTEYPTIYVGPTVGGTLAGMTVIVSVIIVIVVVYRRRRANRYVPFEIDFDSYKLDAKMIDVLEENDEFDSAYFTGMVDDTKKPCGKLLIKELAKFVDTHGEEFFQEEFLKLPRGLIKLCDDAKKEFNLVKNRYTGIFPYDQHRVKLQTPGSDFINASYIDGYNKRREYIASLGPTRKAMAGFQTFWIMVWQENSDIIVMLTNLMEGQKMKCEQYWPDQGTSATYGEITIMTQTEDVYADFIVRKFTLIKGRQQRTLHHLHFTAWPDKRVPDDVSSLLEFRQKVKNTKSILGGPTIVHCSAGIGRTGTYIALDILINQGKARKSLTIFETIVSMRQQRTSMVQTWQQYRYIHQALVHALNPNYEPMRQKQIDHFMKDLDDRRLGMLFMELNTEGETLIECGQYERVINKGYSNFNREGGDVQDSMHRPRLHFDRKVGETNYIDATYMNSYKVKCRFLVCQTPFPDTVKDFLTLIIQESCSCIVSMDPPGLKDKTIGEYFPATTDSLYADHLEMFNVKVNGMETNQSYSLRRLTVTFNKQSGITHHTVYHFQCHHWPIGDRLPDISRFLQLVRDVENMADRDPNQGPVLIHCLNAAERSGLYCAVSNLLQKMKEEGEVSVVNTLRQIKVRRPLAIPNKEQYMFCYRCVHKFLQSECKYKVEGDYVNMTL